MCVREPESCLQISGERRMTITIAAIAAASSKATNRDIMSAKEKEADEQSCVAGRNITLINEDLSALCLSAITHTFYSSSFFS